MQIPPPPPSKEKTTFAYSSLGCVTFSIESNDPRAQRVPSICCLQVKLRNLVFLWQSFGSACANVKCPALSLAEEREGLWGRSKDDVYLLLGTGRFSFSFFIPYSMVRCAPCLNECITSVSNSSGISNTVYLSLYVIFKSLSLRKKTLQAYQQ